MVIPEDPAAEEALLGAILLSPLDNLPVARKTVRIKDFTREAARLTYQAMLDLWDSDTPIDFRTVESALRKPLSYGPGSQWLVGLLQNAPSADAEAYAKRVRYCGTARDILSAANEIAHVGVMYDASNADWNPDTLIAKAVAQLERIVEDRGGGKVFTSEEVAHDYYATLMARMDKDVSAIGYETGFPDLDQIMAWRPGELTYIAGAPSSGKTGLLGTLAESLVDRDPAVPTLFVSVEQPLPQLWDRILAHKSGIDSLRIAKGALSNDERRIVELWLEPLSKRALKFVKEGSLTTVALDAHIQFAVARWGVKVVVVDYVQILGDMPEEDPVRRIGFISGRLRQMAKRYNVAIIVGSQVNAEDKLRWARELEQDAAIILLIKRDKGDSSTSLVVLKNRNGPAGMPIRVYFNDATAHFSPTPVRGETPV